MMEVFFVILGIAIGFVCGMLSGFAIDLKTRKELYKRIKMLEELESEDTE